MRELCRAVLLLLCAGLTHARAAWRAEVTTAKDSGVTIAITSPFEHAPSEGYLPLWVTIRNDSGAARTWNVSCDGSRLYGGDFDHEISAGSLRVENGQTARLPILMVLNSSATNSFASGSIRVDGYAVPLESNTTVPGINAAAKGHRTATVGMSDSLATPIWASLTKRYTDKGQDLIGTPVDLGQLDGDWRGLVGLEAFWLSDADYIALDAPRRAAIRDWVSQGGTLIVCAQSVDPPLRAGLRVPEGGNAAAAGLGHVELWPWDGKPLGLGTVADAIDQTASRFADPATGRADWLMEARLGHIPLNVPFLITFIVVFAVVVGPLNLFWFAGAARRHRLFWTTPLLSVGASLGLAGFIALQDGFGGHGERLMFCLLLPDEKKAVAIQEQAARTGVLFSREFRTSEDLILTALPSTGYGGANERRTREQNGRTYSGDWFSSRSMQTLRAEAVVPSRAEIQLVSADPAAPVLASSVPATITALYYRDPAGKRWRGENLRTGERITLQPDTAEDTDQPSLGGSAALENSAKAFAARPGCFLAIAEDGPFFDTLSSIRWDRQKAVFAGPVTHP